MLPKFELFIRERLYLHNVTPAMISWYTEAFKWLPSESPSLDELKNMVVRMREKGLRATGANSVIRAVNSHLHWCQAPNIKCSPVCTHLRLAQLSAAEKEHILDGPFTEVTKTEGMPNFSFTPACTTRQSANQPRIPEPFGAGALFLPSLIVPVVLPKVIDEHNVAVHIFLCIEDPAAIGRDRKAEIEILVRFKDLPCLLTGQIKVSNRSGRLGRNKIDTAW